MSSESIKNTFSLLIITLVAGLLLGLVYEITKNPIAKEQQKAKEEAYKEVFIDADSFEEIVLDGQSNREFKKQGWDAVIDEAMKVFDKDKNEIGYVLTVTDHEGYGGDIQFAMGVRSDGTLNGISFLSLSETAGLGMKATEEEFYGQYAGKNVEFFSVTKTEASSDNEIDALSGATITSNAMTKAVNSAVVYYKHALGGSANE